jgi:hypothetical protein
MSTAASTPVAVGSSPTSPDQLRGLLYIFACDWHSGVKIHQSYLTDVTKSITDVEQRRALVQSPSRIVETSLLIRGSEAVGYFNSFLQRATSSRFLYPIYSDEVYVTGTVGGSTITCDQTITDRRFVVGGRIAIVGYGPGRRTVTSLTVATILSVGSTLVASAPFSPSAAAGYSVFPLIEGEVILDQTNSVLTDGILQLTLSVSESRGAFSLDPLAQIGANLGGPTFGGYPILTIEPDGGANNARFTAPAHALRSFLTSYSLTETRP